LIAVVTTRSLNDSVGNDTASFFTHTRATRSASASAGTSMSGVHPVSREEDRRALERQPSWYRHNDRGPLLDRLAARQRTRLRIEWLERAEALFADRDRRGLMLVTADFADLRECCHPERSEGSAFVNAVAVTHGVCKKVESAA
jgi:hypothetical protein